MRRHASQLPGLLMAATIIRTTEAVISTAEGQRLDASATACGREWLKP